MTAVLAIYWLLLVIGLRFPVAAGVTAAADFVPALPCTRTSR